MFPTIYPISQVLEACPGEYYSLLSVCQTTFDTVHYTDTRFILLIKKSKIFSWANRPQTKVR